MTEQTQIRSFRGPYHFLSNFWHVPHGIPFGNYEFPTVEHAYVASKSTDPCFHEQVLCCQTPAQAKRLGRTVKLRPHWNKVRFEYMESFLRAKFRPGSKLLQMLLATGDAELVEGNSWHDNTWGSCSCRRCGGRGQNILGKLLMKIRLEHTVKKGGE